ncbi:hypothetical protein DY251_18395 [Mesorhizobium denitrificans]|uniref:Uncharacterized protein n=1 Tax=Mesorhizobium denitrificans TaxID=2294114 RepID=A0A371X679_9HYPH|nr:hypothetical protein DY251_18395 [Mesorhizobium denitrificans]
MPSSSINGYISSYINSILAGRGGDRKPGDPLQRRTTVIAWEVFRKSLPVELFIYTVGGLRPHLGQNLYRQS